MWNVRENPIYDLLALAMILGATVTLVVRGTQPESLVAIGLTLTSLLAAWLRRHDRSKPAPADREDSDDPVRPAA